MEKISAQLLGGIVSTNSSLAHALQKKSNFGEPSGEKINYMLVEALYLHEKGKLEVFQKNKKLSKQELQKKFQKLDKKIAMKYPVFKNLREKGYVLKTALKFGADFRVYEKGKSPGKAHAKWILFVEHESAKITWHEFSAKNRVSHSTKKKLLLAIVDEEQDITYYEVDWKKP